MIRKLRTALAAGLATIALATPVVAQEDPVEEPKRIELGYNALEAGVKSDGDGTSPHLRLFTDADTRVGKYVIGAWGLHESDPSDSSSYFGRDVLTFGPASTMAGDAGKSGRRAALIVKTDEHGVTDAKIGVRDYDLSRLLGDYGWFDASADDEAINATLYVGKAAGKWSFDLLHQIEQPFHGSGRWMYTEAQANRRLSTHTTGYFRVEVDDLDRHTARAIAGLTITPR